MPGETKDEAKAQERLALAGELRTMIDLLHDRDPDVETLRAVLGDTRTATSRLNSVDGPRWEPTSGRGRWQHFSVFRGDWNPLAPPMHIRVIPATDDGDSGAWVEGRVTIPSACEGPPQTAHGGVVAGLIDELLGVAASSLGNGGPAVTGRLEVRYRKPTPLDTELLLTATITEDRGRRLTARAEVFAGDVRTAEATALFIRPIPRQP